MLKTQFDNWSRDRNRERRTAENVSWGNKIL